MMRCTAGGAGQRRAAQQGAAVLGSRRRRGCGSRESCWAQHPQHSAPHKQATCPTCRRRVALALDVRDGAPALLQLVQRAGDVEQAGSVAVGGQLLLCFEVRSWGAGREGGRGRRGGGQVQEGGRGPLRRGPPRCCGRRHRAPGLLPTPAASLRPAHLEGAGQLQGQQVLIQGHPVQRQLPAGGPGPRRGGCNTRVAARRPGAGCRRACTQARRRSGGCGCYPATQTLAVAPMHQHNQGLAKQLASRPHTESPRPPECPAPRGSAPPLACAAAPAAAKSQRRGRRARRRCGGGGAGGKAVGVGAASDPAAGQRQAAPAV